MIGKNTYTYLRKNFSIYHVLIFLLCSFILISHALYVFETKQYPEWDEHRYVGAAIAFHKLFTTIDLNFFSRYDTLLSNYLPSAPPLYPITITLSTLLFGTSQIFKISLFLNAFYYIATIISVYFIARKFYSEFASIMASFIFATYGFSLF